jgi:peptidoglycan-N-acetylglucosamine deacetylase
MFVAEIKGRVSRSVRRRIFTTVNQISRSAWHRRFHGRIGISRVLAIDPAKHRRIGSKPYRSSLPLASLPLEHREVVLTFDDGPLPPYTDCVLDTLAAERARAVFFIVGRMARRWPHLVRRAFLEGHTIGTHTENHLDLSQLSVEDALLEVDAGIASAVAALGGIGAIAPYFRFPFELNSADVEEHLASRGIASWGADVVPKDWTDITPKQLVKRVLSGLEGTGKGIIMLHDIQDRTVRALPDLLRQLKCCGYRISHAIPVLDDK